MGFRAEISLIKMKGNDVFVSARYVFCEIFQCKTKSVHIIVIKMKNDLLNAIKILREMPFKI